MSSVCSQDDISQPQATGTISSSKTVFKGVVYVDGPNGAGKSFLAKRIMERFPGTRYVHCTHRFKDQMFKYHLAALRRALRLAQHGLVVLDRNWLSEEVYAHFYRNGTAWPHQGRIIDKLMLKHSVITVMCLLNRKHATEQVEKHRKNSNYHAPQFLTKPVDVAQRYFDIYEGTELGDPAQTYAEFHMERADGLSRRSDVLGYEFYDDGRNIDDFINLLTGTLKLRQQLQYQPANDFGVRNFAGHIDCAKWFMVGDKVNHDNYKQCWPFMSYTGSTLFMAQAMHELDCLEEEFVWTNADCAENHLEPVLEKHSGLKVISLGKEASRILKVHGVEHVTIPHPSYGRRFLGADKWTELLSEALQKS